MKALRRVCMAVICTFAAAITSWAAAAESIDMHGKTALVTGSTSGLGEVVARRLGAMGATVIVHGLNEQRGAEIAAEITRAGPGKAVYYSGDLGSLAQVRALAAKVKSNYLSHFLLTRELLPLLEASAPARIVNVASIGQRPINFDDVMMQNNYQTMAAYSQSKLAQIMFTITLSEMLDPKLVTVNSLHPATMMDTPMVIDSGRQPMSSVQDGANAVMQLAVGTGVAGRTGLYFNQMNEGRANAQAYDAAARQRLWDLSVQLTAGK
jgi:NAD(P)-dependent dehydrogenase (short-subunit alcohol dehydrogenase family)